MKPFGTPISLQLPIPCAPGHDKEPGMVEH